MQRCKDSKMQRRTNTASYIKKFLAFSFAFLFFGLIFAKSASAQVLILSPSAASKNVGENLSIDINIDTEGKAIAGADIKFTYDPTILQIVSVSNPKTATGEVFDEGASNFSTSGTVYIVRAFSQALKTFGGDKSDATLDKGKVATITFKGKKAGTGTLAFVCSADTNDTNLIDVNSNDLAKCSRISNGTYTILEASGEDNGDDGDETASPTATPTPRSRTPTTTPPVSGVALPTIMSFGLGAILTIIGLAVIF